MEWAEELSAVAPLTVKAHKLALERLFSLVADGAENPSIDEVERARLAAWDSDDAVEGRAAFMEKRAPRFRGR